LSAGPGKSIRLLRLLLAHPLQIRRRIQIQILASPAAPHGGAHFVGGNPIEAAVTQAVEEGLVVDEAGAEGDGVGNVPC